MLTQSKQYDRLEVTSNYLFRKIFKLYVPPQSISYPTYNRNINLSTYTDTLHGQFLKNHGQFMAY